MNDRDQRRYDRLTRVQTFGKTHAADFSSEGAAAENFAALDAIIKQMDDAKAAQTPARVSKATLLDALILDLRNITRTAAAIDLKQAGFLAPYRLPDSLTEGNVLTHAHAMLTLLADAPGDAPAAASAKAALRARFVAYDLPATFVEDLRAATNALKEARQLNQAETQEGVASTADLSRLFTTANEIVTHLDAVMHNKYARVPQTLREWESARHIERGPVSAKASANTTISTPAASPTPATA